ncbi:hypothetical protein SAMN05216421_1163 [Halopseudomonas xinjiangensis]|uniref:Uncharacterized protein n=1 Tax=Halopseudomonas xinjiangensis TaxID=487184 RepID=A0A1H1QLF9_9GAMM|nr:hypothetical protein [Halopseudomonas xinjiangensis]SDS24183.1 hypothetical protein SAMN05216421_1163 [Halopseudomonas xinjiangensis]
MKAGDSFKDKPAAGPERSPRGYAIGMFGGLVVSMAVFATLLLGLGRTGHLPPPAFSNSICVDEKLAFMRDHPVADPNLLIVGSSVAWRHVDSSTLSEHAPGVRPLNGAFCGLHANQTLYVANWLLDREPGIRDVVMVVDPIDFSECAVNRDAIFNREDADRYVYADTWPWQYYMRYFAPGSLLRNAASIKTKRTDPQSMDPLRFTPSGAGPLTTSKSRGLFYGAPPPLDPVCFASLKQLATRLDQEGRRFTVVSTPLHPAWKAQVDPDGTLLKSFDSHLLEALSGTDGQYWNVDREWAPSEDGFVDAIHMRWPAAKEFSENLGRRLRWPTLAGPS